MADSDEDLATIASMVGVPEGAMPEHGVVIVGYLDAEGEPKFGCRTLGERTISGALGLMALAGHHLSHIANPTPCEGDDED